jgi:trigger factor
VVFSLQLEVQPAVDVADVGGLELVRLRPDPPDPSLEQAAEQHLRRQLFDALLDRYPVDLPEEMADHEFTRICRGFEAEVGTPPDEATRQQLEEIAARRCRLAVLLTEIGNVHDIRVTRAEIESLIEQEAAVDPDHRSEIVDYYMDHPTALAELQSPLFEERVVGFLMSRCKVTERVVPAEELRSTLDLP